jgi:D-alanine-D-alanine ligase
MAPGAHYDFHHKYHSEKTAYLSPPNLPAPEHEAIQELTLRAFKALGCRGWARADVMIDSATRKPYILEINASPGMTAHSLAPMAAKAAGIGYEEFCLDILRLSSLDSKR